MAHDGQNHRPEITVLVLLAYAAAAAKDDGDALLGDDGDVADVAAVAAGQRLQDEDHLEGDRGRIEVGRH